MRVYFESNAAQIAKDLQARVIGKPRIELPADKISLAVCCDAFLVVFVDSHLT